MTLSEQMLEIHHALTSASLPHAFGGALALAWCTERARGTIDLDINVFVGPEEAPRVLAALPPGVGWTDHDRTVIERDGQVRLWWDATPVDIFLNTTPFHEEVAGRARWEPFAGDSLPFLGCDDLAVFKAFFGRTQDWADLEAMAAAGTLDVEAVLGVITHYLGADDERIEHLRSLG